MNIHQYRAECRKKSRDNTKSLFQHKEDYKPLRGFLFKTFNKNEWYSSQEIFKYISSVIDCKTVTKSSIILNFLFETEEKLKYVNGKKTRGFLIKNYK
jgi:hypothetical protein